MSYITEPPGSVRFSHSRARGIFCLPGRGAGTPAAREGLSRRSADGISGESGGGAESRVPRQEGFSCGPARVWLLWKEPHLFLMAEAPVPSLSV